MTFSLVFVRYYRSSYFATRGQATATYDKIRDPTERPPSESFESASSKSGLTAKDLMGDVSMEGETAGKAKQGGVASWYKDRLAAKEEDQARKMEKWQEVMAKKAAAKEAS